MKRIVCKHYCGRCGRPEVKIQFEILGDKICKKLHGFGCRTLTKHLCVMRKGGGKCRVTSIFLEKLEMPFPIDPTNYSVISRPDAYPVAFAATSSLLKRILKRKK